MAAIFRDKTSQYIVNEEKAHGRGRLLLNSIVIPQSLTPESPGSFIRWRLSTGPHAQAPSTKRARPLWERECLNPN